MSCAFEKINTYNLPKLKINFKNSFTHENKFPFNFCNSSSPQGDNHISLGKKKNENDYDQSPDALCGNVVSHDLHLYRS